MVEKAIFICHTGDLKYVTTDYSRLYFGNEFCERLIPPAALLEKVLLHIKKHQLNFSLVTPFVTNAGLFKLKALFDLLRKRDISCEVVFNDWGTLNLIGRNYSNLTPVLGRLLTKQKRGPNLIRLLARKKRKYVALGPSGESSRHIMIEKELPLSLDDYYKGSNAASVPIIHRFLLSQKIRRIELDNIQQGMLLELPRGQISASVYFPYVYISTAFYCPSAGCDMKDKSFLRIKPCSRECQKYIFTLRNQAFHKIIFLKGNTQFYKNPKISQKPLERMGVDRIVYEPVPPV